MLDIGCVTRIAGPTTKLKLSELELAWMDGGKLGVRNDGKLGGLLVVF